MPNARWLVCAWGLTWILACGFGGNSEDDAVEPPDQPEEPEPSVEPGEPAPPDEPEELDLPAIEEIPGWDENLQVQRPTEHDADEADTSCTARAFLRPTETQIKLRDAPQARSQPMGKIRPPFAGAHLQITARTGDYFEVASVDPFDPDQAARIIGRPSGWIDSVAASATPVPCTDAEGQTVEPHLRTEPDLEAESLTRLLPQPLDLLECEGGWWRVWAPRQGAVGWLSDDHICEDPAQSCRMSCTPPEE